MLLKWRYGPTSRLMDMTQLVGCLACFIALFTLASLADGKQLVQLQSLPTFLVNKTIHGCPRSSVYDDPWVKENVVVTYGLKIRDGLGSQTARMLGVYAVAHALGIPYYHSPLECIGHIGGVPHYRNMRCDMLSPQDMQKTKRIAKHIHLPSMTKANVSSWDRQYMFRADWTKLANLTAAALAAKRPTVMQLELLDGFISVCPDIFYHVPSWKPKETPAVWSAATNVTSSHQAGSSSWLLHKARSVRIVVHMRRGDLATASSKRELPAVYYINLVKNIIKVLESVNQDFTVEWFTEPSSNPKEHEDMMAVRREVPNLTLLFDSDLLWTWHQMWTADVFIMSKSGYSFVPAVVNTNALIIHAPAAGIKKCKIACSPSHWFDAKDELGNITEEIKKEIKRRAGCPDAQ